jgi:hypothetical protein
LALLLFFKGQIECPENPYQFLFCGWHFKRFKVIVVPKMGLYSRFNIVFLVFMNAEHLGNRPTPFSSSAPHVGVVLVYSQSNKVFPFSFSSRLLARSLKMSTGHFLNAPPSNPSKYSIGFDSVANRQCLVLFP